MTRSRLKGFLSGFLIGLLAGSFGFAARADEPKALLLFGNQADIFIPSQPKIRVPSGSEVGACSDVVMLYHPVDKVFVMPEPCATDTLFKNGFE